MMNTNKESNKTRALVAAIILCISLLFTTGCSSADVTNDVKSALGMEVAAVSHTVYVVDQTKYSAKYDLNQLLSKTISENYAAYDSTSTIIRLDGDAKVVDHLTYTNNGKGGGATWKEKDKLEATNSVIKSIINNTSPVADEVNVLKAIRLACDELQTYDDGIKRIVIVSSMIQTVDPLNMAGGLDAYSDSDTINETVADLSNIHELPDMRSIESVTVYGLGHVDTTSGEQAELSQLDSTNLQVLWLAIFESCGCGCSDVTFKTNTPDGAPLDIDYPSVTPVTASDIGNHFVYADTTTNESINLKDDVLCFNDVSLSFQPDSAELITSENEALKVLSPVISYATSQDVTIAVFASTAWSDDKEALYDLSSARANTVKTLLIKAGVQEESIRCYPLGYDLNPFKCDCFNSSGKWDEDNAKKNRVVYITDASSAVANVFYQNLD